MTERGEAEARLRRLIRDLGADLSAMEERAKEAAEIASTAGAPGASSVLAVALHHWYTALESSLERALRFLDGSVPEGADWHAALIAEAVRPLPGVRDALLSPEVWADLSELRRFRRFFRHAYAVALDWGRLVDNAGRLARVHPVVVADLRRLEAALGESLGRLDGEG